MWRGKIIKLTFPLFLGIATSYSNKTLPVLLSILLAVVYGRGFLYLCIFESIIDFGFFVGVYLADVVAWWGESDLGFG